MDEAAYAIETAASGMLRATVRGFWSMATVENYLDALTREFERVRRRREPVRLLIDATTLPTQQAGVGERFAQSWTALLTGTDDRAAMVLGSALAAMQARRLCESERCRVFDNVAAAEHWVNGVS